jgi:hypothetical protein
MPVVGNSVSVTQLITLAKVGLSVFEQVLCDGQHARKLKQIPYNFQMHYLLFINVLRDVSDVHYTMNDSYVAWMK